MKLKLKLIAIVLGLATMVGAQVRKETDSQTVSVSGSQVVFNDSIGSSKQVFEYLITGAPATVSVVLSGCMRGGTCDTLDTYTTVANSNRSVAAAYDYYRVVASWTGGTAPTIQVNRLTLAAGGGSGGLPSGFSSAANQIIGPNGSTASPTYSFVGSTNSGLWSRTPGFVNLSDQGVAGGIEVSRTLGADELKVAGHIGLVANGGIASGATNDICYDGTGAGPGGTTTNNIRFGVFCTSSSADFQVRIAGVNDGYLGTGSVSELITLSTGGTTTDSTNNLLPAGANILGVGCRVATTITTATNWSVGDSSTATRFITAQSVLTAGTTAANAVAPANQNQPAAGKLRITTTGTPGAGAIRCSTYYQLAVAPTS